jgi:hypothetical protein
MPFVSWGGTSMLANGLMVGVLLNISRHRVADPSGLSTGNLGKGEGERGGRGEGARATADART